MEKWGKIILIEDDEDLQYSLKSLLDPHATSVRVAQSTAQALEFLTLYQPDIWLVDLSSRWLSAESEERIRPIKAILSQNPETVIILLCTPEDEEIALQTIPIGVMDYQLKPWDDRKLITTMKSAFTTRLLRQKVDLLSKQLRAVTENTLPNSSILGNCPAIQEVRRKVALLGKIDANILIIGEKGTGKDLVAQLLHQPSTRSAKPFIKIDLREIPDNQIEGALFGFSKEFPDELLAGKPGCLETANGGTLFLSEIDKLSHAIQQRIVEIFEDHSIKTVDGRQRLDLRLICANIEPIKPRALIPSFENRINSYVITIPPLRERGEDILLLADYFLRYYATQYGKSVKELNREVQNSLLTYKWPGNVRELRHLIERGVIASTGKTITALNLQPAATPKSEKIRSLNLEEVEKESINIALKRSEGNISKAATLLGITRFTLYRKMEKHHLTVPSPDKA